MKKIKNWIEDNAVSILTIATVGGMAVVSAGVLIIFGNYCDKLLEIPKTEEAE